MTQEHLARAMEETAIEERVQRVQIPSCTSASYGGRHIGLARLGLPVRVTETVLNQLSSTKGEAWQSTNTMTVRKGSGRHFKRGGIS